MSEDANGLSGHLLIQLWDENGNLKHEETVKNLITTAGDLYYATRGAAAVVPATPADATKVTGMKLGTSVTAASKSGGGAALGAYKTASNVVFDATYPTVTAVGGDGGYNINYRVTWPAGTATDTALTEAVIVNDAASNATSTAGNTIARVVFSAINKGASDSLTITWTHKFLGA